MHSSIHITVFGIAIFMMASCNGVTGSGTQDIVTSSGAKDSLDQVELTPDVQVLEYEVDSLEDIYRYMNQADSADAYRAGIIGEVARQYLPYADSLLRSKAPYFVIVDKQTMFVVVYDRFGRQQAAYRMACSAKYGTKHARRDNRTPEGYFTAEGIYNSTEWLYTDDDGHTSEQRGQFGPRYIRLKTPVTSQVGIHGTCAPWSRGRRASHGCIRLHNAHILEMMKYATKGMPIIVNPSDRDQDVNRAEGYTVPQLHFGPFTENPIDEDVKGYLDYTHREDSIRHVRDSLATLRIERERLRLEADSIAKIQADSSVYVPQDTIE